MGVRGGPGWRSGQLSPIARSDAYQVNEDKVLTVLNGVLANDIDPDGDRLTCRVDPSGGPCCGRLTLSSNGAFTYTPGANFNGSDGFVYIVNDRSGATDRGAVTITVRPVDDPPVAVDLSEKSAANGRDDAIILRGSDVDGDALTFRLETLPQHGSFSDNTPPFLRYTPDFDYVGGDFFTYTAFDGAVRSSAATVTLNVVPKLDIHGATLVEGQPFICRFPGDRAFDLTFELSAPSPVPIDLNLGTNDGTATRGNDFKFFPDNGSNFERFTIPANRRTASPPAELVVSDCVCEPDERFEWFYQVDPSSLPNVVEGNRTTTITIINDDGDCFGTAALEPAEATVEAKDRLHYSLTWTHPERWRLLHDMDLRVGDLLDLRWNEEANTLRLVDASGASTGPEVAPGSHGRLETAGATVYPEECSVVGSGPTGPSVTLHLSVSFKPQAAGKSHAVEVFATDDAGHQQSERLGTVVVTGGPGSAAAAAEPAAGGERRESTALAPPARFAASATPNPVGGSGTSIQYEIPEDQAGQSVAVRVYDVSGRLVRALESGVKPAGRYAVGWDLRDSDGHRIPNGLFLYRVSAGSRQITRKLVVVGR